MTLLNLLNFLFIELSDMSQLLLSCLMTEFPMFTLLADFIVETNNVLELTLQVTEFRLKRL